MSAIADDLDDDEDDERLPPPAAFGRYEVLFSIAKGGMAEVFAARVRGEGSFERYFAVKRMARSLIRHEKFVQSFLDEARITACIHSPHVVQVVDLGRDERGAPYLVMELVHGVSLSVLKKRLATPLPLHLVAEIGSQAALGLDDAHSATDARGEALHIVHRDVSPQNIIVGVDGRVRVADFGIARAKQRLAAGTQSGELKGKFGYFAPEQLRGGADSRTDVFALGIVLWELVAGHPLFHRAEVVDTLLNVERLPIPRLDGERADVPAAFADVVARALERDPSARYASAAELARALRALIDQRVVGPRATDVELRTLARTAAASLLDRLQRAASGEHDLDAVALPLAPTAPAEGRDGSTTRSGGPTSPTTGVTTRRRESPTLRTPVSEVLERPSERPTAPRVALSSSEAPIEVEVSAPVVSAVAPVRAVAAEGADQVPVRSSPARRTSAWALGVVVVLAVLALAGWQMGSGTQDAASAPPVARAPSSTVAAPAPLTAPPSSQPPAAPPSTTLVTSTTPVTETTSSGTRAEVEPDDAPTRAHGRRSRPPAPTTAGLVEPTRSPAPSPEPEAAPPPSTTTGRRVLGASDFDRIH